MQKIKFKVNGMPREVMAWPEMALIDFLREDLRLTGTKQSCDRKGQCGACTVIVNKKAVRSCILRVVNLEGADVITIEGLGTPENPHIVQEAFVLSGAIQCGFCTPGLIMATKALLDQNNDPDMAAIKQAMGRNLCRCTGYKRIIEAVKLAGRFIRGETSPQLVRNKLSKKMLGVSQPRPTAMIKACGLAQFSADISMPLGTIEIAVARSKQFHAIIKSVDTSVAAKMPGVIGFLMADDIKGTNRIRLRSTDLPVLCEDKVRVLGDPIVAVAAETRAQARAAAAAVEVEYESLPVMATIEEAMAPEAFQIHPHAPNNIVLTQPLIKGDARKALREAKYVVEGEFFTQINHQAALEPEVSVAYFEGQSESPQLVVVGRSIDINSHLAQIKEATGYPNMRYREAFVGGQFGIKLLITTEAITAAVALHFKRPARYVPTLEESLLITSKRHSYKMKVQLAADASGHITAYMGEILVNKGAYYTVGDGVLMRSLQMLQGSYHIPNIEVIGKMVHTNSSPGGAARGAGPPQSHFATESMVDILSERIGIDPLELRRMNLLKPGQTKATGMVVTQWPVDMLFDAIKPHYEQAKQKAKAFNDDGGEVKRGVGIAVTSFGVGGAGHMAKMALEIDPDGGITIYAAVADPGEGNDSMLMQIAAHLTGLPVEKIRLYTRDTDKALSTGPASASRQTFMAGTCLVNVITQMQKVMKEAGTETYAGLKKAGKPTHYETSFKIEGGQFDPNNGQGPSFVTDIHNIQMAEVEVNTATGAVRVLKMTSAVDAGTIINPQTFDGQIEGGMDQGVGYALREEFILGKSKDYVTFKFPTIRDMFDNEVITRETPRTNGPLGATGIGEMTMVSTAPAVMNAIYNACGARIYRLPATPEKVKAAIKSIDT